MTVHSRSELLKAALLFGLLITLSSRSAYADPPNSVVRTFAFKGPLSAEPDFLSDASVAVVVAPPPQTSLSLLQFVPDGDVDELLDGTTWVYQPAMHVSAGPDEDAGAFLWLLSEDTPEPPPTGSRTLTGPDSPLILEQKVFFVRLLTGPPAAGKYMVDPESPDDIFVVVTAVFSR